VCVIYFMTFSGMIELQLTVLTTKLLVLLGILSLKVLIKLYHFHKFGLLKFSLK